MNERWLVAMSGGVDSSVAAALLARAGAEVLGVTMDLGEGSARDHAVPGAKKCCGLPDAEDAAAVARRLGFRHYVANYRRAFAEAVVQPFVEAYASGETPIPCIACNRVLKFDRLLRRARALGARGVATGHYARIARDAEGRFGLYRARDRHKDQTYFMFDIPTRTLGELRFPLGDLNKDQVREVARELELPNADKPESQGICFVPDGDVRAALGRLRPELRGARGEIVDELGRILGRHDGAAGYTVGQRKGLGLSGGPWYVREIQAARNRLVVGRDPAVLRLDRIRARESNWLAGGPPEGEVRVQVRHASRSVPARLLAGPQPDEVEIELAEPVWAPGPGQAAVVYDAADERVLGGGWIAGAR